MGRGRGRGRRRGGGRWVVLCGVWRGGERETERGIGR